MLNQLPPLQWWRKFKWCLNMKVSKYKAYRIVDAQVGATYNIGDELSIPHYNMDDYSPEKKTIEQILEATRPNNFPSRNEALFVFPASQNDYESVWANYKYSHTERDYLLLELELAGDLYWLNADLYNGPLFNQNQRQKAKEYWKEIAETDFTRDMDIEGLFVGVAKIIKIQPKRHLSNCENAIIY